MPLLVLACRMCPKSIEGTMYALLMSTLNFGSIISQNLGSILINILGITEEDFTNLNLLIVITYTLQIIPLVLINVIDIKAITEAI